MIHTPNMKSNQIFTPEKLDACLKKKKRSAEFQKVLNHVSDDVQLKSFLTKSSFSVFHNSNIHLIHNPHKSNTTKTRVDESDRPHTFGHVVCCRQTETVSLVLRRVTCFYNLCRFIWADMFTKQRGENQTASADLKTTTGSSCGDVSYSREEEGKGKQTS